MHLLTPVCFAQLQAPVDTWMKFRLKETMEISDIVEFEDSPGN